MEGVLEKKNRSIDIDKEPTIYHLPVAGVGPCGYRVEGSTAVRPDERLCILRDDAVGSGATLT